MLAFQTLHHFQGQLLAMSFLLQSVPRFPYYYSLEHFRLKENMTKTSKPQRAWRPQGALGSNLWMFLGSSPLGRLPSELVLTALQTSSSGLS